MVIAEGTKKVMFGGGMCDEVVTKRVSGRRQQERKIEVCDDDEGRSKRDEREKEGQQGNVAVIV